MIQLRWKLLPLYLIGDNYIRDVRRVLQYKLPFGEWKDVPEFINPRDYDECEHHIMPAENCGLCADERSTAALSEGQEKK